LAGALFNAAGAVLRYTGRNSYRSVYIGTLFAAVAQSFTLATPPLIAGHWFGASERGTATALGVLANQAGTALGLGVTCAVDFNRSNLQERLQVYLGVQAAVAAVAVLLVYIFVADHPPTPPSVATAFLLQSASTVAPHDCVSNTTEETYLLPPPRQEKMDDSSSYTKQIAPPNYWQSIRLVVGEWSSISFLLSFGMSVGVYYTLPTFFSQLLPHGDGTHWSFTVTGWLGVSYQLAGVLGSFVSGRLVDATQHYRAASLLLLGVAALSLLVFGVTASVAPLGSSRLAVAGFVLGVVGSGFSLAAWNTVGLEFGTSLSYPANEAAVAGILECAAELAGFLWVTIGGFLIETAHAEFLFVLVAAAGASFLLLGFNHTEAKRPR
jgi:MFS family permease